MTEYKNILLKREHVDDNEKRTCTGASAAAIATQES
jgi:hypothetical protein